MDAEFLTAVFGIWLFVTLIVLLYRGAGAAARSWPERQAERAMRMSERNYADWLAKLPPPPTRETRIADIDAELERAKKAIDAMLMEDDVKQALKDQAADNAAQKIMNLLD